ncbi:gamma-glutamylcyclotransferase family protein [Porticoccaceae bacterium LTM1]|nr:gamma-glutamylcyclotransferase family protein [Porticoccaceae bacterium LTM1]
MNPKKLDVFFYGLFMDEQVLRQAGVEPSNCRRAYVDDYALRIGQRAALVPVKDARAYGMLISLTQSELNHLYSAPGLGDYCPEKVVAHLSEHEVSPAICYMLAQPFDLSARDPEYVERLKRILNNLKFPSEYVESVK